MIARCPHCGEPYVAAEYVPHQRAAGGKAAANLPAEEPWESVARGTNLAEIGFLADLLEAHGIGTRVHHRDQFHGEQWHGHFELLVHQDRAGEARVVLRNEVEQFVADASDDSLKDPAAPGTVRQEGPGHASAAQPRSVWPSLVWAAAAVGVTCVVSQLAGERRPSPFPPNPASWQELAESSPYWSAAAPHQRRQGLEIDADSRTIWFLEDRDGDGEVDGRRVWLSAR